MLTCPKCKAEITGDYQSCPLCLEALKKENTSEDKRDNPYPAIPLRFKRRKALQLLMFSSVAICGLFLLLEALWLDQRQGLQLAVFGVLSLWTVVYIIIRKRRNIAKSVTYLYVVFSCITGYLDFATGWEAWSTTYAIPVISIFSILALELAVEIVDLDIGDYVMYLVISIALGFFPALFLFFDWVTDPIPTIISIGFCGFMFLIVLFFHGGSIWHEWKKRMHI